VTLVQVLVGGQNIWDHFYQEDGLMILEDGWQKHGFENTYHPMHHGRIFHRDDSLEKCMNMQANYVHVVVDSLKERFLDFLVFNAYKLFSPKYFPIEEETHINMCEQ
jgi:hypothetical protein